MTDAGTNPGGRDIRLTGFDDRASLATAWAWLDAQPMVATTEAVPLALAAGRVLAGSITSPHDLPNGERAATDGYAVRASDCDGANAYNPLLLEWREPGAAILAAGAACPVAAGWALPGGADAVLPFEAAQRSGARGLEVLAPVAPGIGIDRPGCELATGADLLQRGRRLRPQDLGCLALLSFASVEVLRRPRVRLVSPGPKSGPEALIPLLSALLARDGALVDVAPVGVAGEAELAASLAGLDRKGADLVLIAGRSGAGPDDIAALALLAAGGALDLHGLALNPGGSAGLGMVPGPGGSLPIVLLPGEPFACLVAYDMLAARLVRRLSGAGAELPYVTAECELDRKITSGIGVADVVPVRMNSGRARPISVEGLAAATQADGFVVVAEASEGYPAGARVRVHLYGAGLGAS